MRIVAGLLAMLLIVGCSSKDGVPSGIIPRVEMEKVLWDMIQADQYSSLYLLKDSSRINVKTETQKLYQEIFQLHQISREDFRKSFQYYQEHPDLTRSVFDSLLARGNRLRTESYSRPSLTAKPGVTAAPALPTSGPPLRFPKPSGMNPNRPVIVPGSPLNRGIPPLTVVKPPVPNPKRTVVIPRQHGAAADTAKGKRPK